MLSHCQKIASAQENNDHIHTFSPPFTGKRMSKKSNWFVVATEGATTDGRKISREWLTQISKNYDPKKYGARINLEHLKFRYMWKDDPHSLCYGDVVAVKTEENSEGKLQLLAQIEPTEDLIQLVRNKQKVYTSVEIDLNFADTGEAYLVGLAVTDNPASLGTEYLTFCSGATHSPLTDRKQKPDNLITEAMAFSVEFTESKPSFLEKFTAIFSKNKTENDSQFAEHEQAFTMLAEKFTQLEQQLQEIQTTNTALQTQLTALETQNAEFAQKFAMLAKQENKQYTPAPTQTGGKHHLNELTDY